MLHFDYANIKKYFITGLVILLPVALTIAIVIFIFNLLTEPFAGAVKSLFDYYHLFEHGFLFLSSDQLQQVISQLLIFCFLFLMTISLGAIAKGFLVHIFHFGERLLARIPLVNAIYKTSKDVVRTMFTSSNKAFKQVVLAPFPNPNVYSIGLITKETLPTPVEEYAKRVAVFVPTTPNPTSGFLMMFHPEELIYLDMNVEEAFKFVVSCGILPMPFKIITKEEAAAKMSKENK